MHKKVKNYIAAVVVTVIFGAAAVANMDISYGSMESEKESLNNLKNEKADVEKILAELEAKLEARKLHPMFLTGHTGWTDNFTFAFAHKDKLCSPFKKRVHDPSAPYDAYEESDDTEERSKSGYLKGVGR